MGAPSCHNPKVIPPVYMYSVLVVSLRANLKQFLEFGRKYGRAVTTVNTPSDKGGQYSPKASRIYSQKIQKRLITASLTEKNLQW